MTFVVDDRGANVAGLFAEGISPLVVSTLSRKGSGGGDRNRRKGCCYIGFEPRKSVGTMSSSIFLRLSPNIFYPVELTVKFG